jgi:hypothetical protein
MHTPSEKMAHGAHAKLTTRLQPHNLLFAFAKLSPCKNALRYRADKIGGEQGDTSQ